MRTDVVADVGNVDAQAEMAVGQFYDVDGIVKVFGIFTVNRNELTVAVVAAAVFEDDGLVDGIGFGRYLFRKGKRQAVAGHDNLDVEVAVAVIAEDFRHFPFGLAIPCRPFGNRHQDAGTAAGIARFIERNVDIFTNPFIIRLYKSAVFFQLEGTD